MENSKTHYRKVFKSDHLGSADLEEMQEEGKRLVFTIDHVKQEYDTQVAGRKINANIAYFKEQIKPLVLNATNSKQMAKFTGSKFVEDWGNTLIELYIDSSVKMKGEVVGGIRIKPTQPTATKQKMTPEHPLWGKSKVQVAQDGTPIEDIRKHYEITDAHYKDLIS
jgi:hypothetical protein